MNKNVAILGATDDPVKYANRALKMLVAHGYNPIPVNPTKDLIDGLKCYPTLGDIPEPIDTVTIYVRPSVSAQLLDDILAVKPRRVIMNPGTENEEVVAACEGIGITVVRACTLVLLQTGQF